MRKVLVPMIIGLLLIPTVYAQTTIEITEVSWFEAMINKFLKTFTVTPSTVEQGGTVKWETYYSTDCNPLCGDYVTASCTFKGPDGTEYGYAYDTGCCYCSGKVECSFAVSPNYPTGQWKVIYLVYRGECLGETVETGTEYFTVTPMTTTTPTTSPTTTPTTIPSEDCLLEGYDCANWKAGLSNVGCCDGLECQETEY